MCVWVPLIRDKLCDTFLSSPYLGLNQYNYVHTGTETQYSEKIRSSDAKVYGKFPLIGTKTETGKDHNGRI